MAIHDYTSRDIERFRSKVNVTANDTDCWEWQASYRSDGYGQFYYAGKTVSSHRVAYEIANGKISGGLWVLHRCDNPKCCNPNHLFLGTRKDNDQDKMNKGRQPNGEKCAFSKLTTEKVAAIRRRYVQGGVTQELLGIEFGVGQSVVSRIVNKKAWQSKE